jgi:hypothetical protein
LYLGLGYSFASLVLVSLAGNPSFVFFFFPSVVSLYRCTPGRLMALLIQSRARGAFNMQDIYFDAY